MKSRNMRWLAWPAIAAVLALLAVLAPSAQVTHADSACTGTKCDMAIVAPVAPQPLGVPFNVDINVDTDSADFGGYQDILSYSTAVVNVASITQKANPPLTLCAGTGPIDNVTLPMGSAQDTGCVTSAPPYGAFTGTVTRFSMVCIAPGVATLRLVTTGEDPSFGSAVVRGTTPIGPMTTNTLPDASVTCEMQADLRINKVGAPTIAVTDAGVDITYTIIGYNDGPNPAYAVFVTETFDPPGSYVVDTSPYGCADVSAIVVPPRPFTYLCALTNPANPADSMLPGTSKVFTFTVHLPPELAGKVVVNGASIQSFNPITKVKVITDPNQQPQPTLGAADFYNCLGGPAYPPTVGPTSRLAAGLAFADPQPTMAGPNCDNVTVVQTQVLPANVSVTKVAETVPGVVNGTEVWDVTVSNAAGGSAATTVSVKDTVDTNQSIVSAAGTNWVCGAATGTPGVTPANNVTCTLTGSIAAGAAAPVLKVTANVLAAVGTQCNNSATATFADPATATGTGSVVCVTPDVKMIKSSDSASCDADGNCNLWICKNPAPPAAPVCEAGNGQGSISINELVYNVAADPDGVGAFEFVARFNHKVLNVSIAATSWLAANGRLVICDATIIDENAIHFACVSKDPDWQSDPGTPPAGATTGGILPAIAAILTVTPTVDMTDLLTPGQNNGVVTTIVDDNCELADIYGDPLSSGDDPITGRPILLPGVLPGGGIAICTNITLTVRILEGDLNVDCVVNVADDQAIAYRYGAANGNLLYLPWYDLEPALRDNDIDVKDLQKVFGRNGSTCNDPIPSYQTPLGPPDP